MRSRNTHDVLEIVPVSLISGSMLFRVWRIMLASVTDLAMMTKSSMNRRSSSAWICWLIRMLQAFLSMVPMKIHAKTTAHGVPMAVPHICRYSLPLNSK